MFKKIFNRKILVVILAFSAFVLGPTIDAQMTKPATDKDSWIDAQVVQSWTLIGDPSLQIGGYPY